MFRFLTAAAVALLAACASTPSAPPAAVADLAPTGTLRAAINFGNPILATRDAATGEPRGVSVDLVARARAGASACRSSSSPSTPRARWSASRSAQWDVAYVAIDPARAGEISFTAPYVVIEGAYLVPNASPIKANAEVDRAGMRIAVGPGQRLRSVPVARAEAGHARARADVASGDRHDGRAEARGRSRCEAAARSRRPPHARRALARRAASW